MTNKQPDWADEIASQLNDQWTSCDADEEWQTYVDVESLAAALRKAKADGFRMCKKAMLGERIGPISNELNSMADEIERGEAPEPGNWHGGKWLGRDNT